MIERFVFLLTASVSLAAVEKGLHKLTSGVLLHVNIKQRQDKPSYLYHSSNILVGQLSLSKQLLALMLSTLACPYYTVSESGITNKLPALMPVLCLTSLLGEKPQNGTVLVAWINLLSTLRVL